MVPAFCTVGLMVGSLPASGCVRSQRARATLLQVLSGALVLLLCACGKGQAQPDFVVRSTAIVVNSDAPFTKRADFPGRIESTIEAALLYWGGTWAQLEGKTIAFEGGLHVSCSGAPDAIGCYESGEMKVSTRDANLTVYCVEETVLVHEVGHAVIGDPDHTDPRWMDFSSVVRDLEGRPGYDGNGDVPCRIDANVWRHP
jgi:hypothetical protein